MSSTAAASGLPPDVIGLTIPTTLPVGSVNLYLLVGEPLTLVDTGPDSASGLVELERRPADHGHRVEDLELIVLTHEHPDHAGLAGVIARAAGRRSRRTPALARNWPTTDGSAASATRRRAS